MKSIDKDPVCGMSLSAHRNEIVYAGIRYGFCSDQCRERFEANPHLYIGTPGHKAPGQRDMHAVKRRRFRLEQPLPAQEGELLAEYLRTMMGVREVHVDGKALDVTYDLMQASAEQIETHLAEIGLKLGDAWPERLRRGFIHFMEESEVLGLEEPPHKKDYF